MVTKLAPCAESTLTDRYQTTIPDPVRKALGLNKRDKISYRIQANGEVVISRLDQDEDDPLIGAFLEFITQDIEQNPQHLHPISSDLVTQVQSLVEGVDFDLDAPLPEEED